MDAQEDMVIIDQVRYRRADAIRLGLAFDETPQDKDTVPTPPKKTTAK